MTLKQFRELTKDMDENLDIFMGERLTEYKYGLVNSVGLKEIGFMEDYLDTIPKAKAEVIVITED